jgi:protein CrcB
MSSEKLNPRGALEVETDDPQKEVIALVTTPTATMSAAQSWLLILYGAVGGFMGSGLRVGLGISIPPQDCDLTGNCGGVKLQRFPLSTFTVNVMGTFILCVLGRISMRQKWDTAVMAVLGGGFCGGLTTMSSFVLDSIKLWANDG